MSPEIIQLEDYYLSRLHVDFHFPQEEETMAQAFSLSFDYDALKHAHDSHRRMLRLRVNGCQLDAHKEKVGIDIDVEINGVFRLPEQLEVDHREALLRVNGVSILYSTLRGIIGNLSGSFPEGRLCLPTILPNAIVQQIEAKKQAVTDALQKTKKKAAKKSAKKPSK